MKILEKLTNDLRGYKRLPLKWPIRDIYSFALMAAVVYQEAEEIQSDYKNNYRILVQDLPECKGQCLVLFNDKKQIQNISIRGTHNLGNAIKDGAYLKTKDPKTGLYMHHGFWESAVETYQAILPGLKKEYLTYLTGHSLGGAVAAILHLFLLEDGFRVKQTITFGQPKFTNIEAIHKYRRIPLLRVINEKDFVPLTPPEIVFSDHHGEYCHIGPEVILFDDVYYSYLDHHLAERKPAQNFWENLLKGEAQLEDHFMAHYLAHLQGKMRKSIHVHYKKRETHRDKKNKSKVQSNFTD
jgi:triacylglycerol lipase